jgi:hypothetical protein
VSGSKSNAKVAMGFQCVGPLPSGLPLAAIRDLAVEETAGRWRIILAEFPSVIEHLDIASSTSHGVPRRINTSKP